MFGLVKKAFFGKDKNQDQSQKAIKEDFSKKVDKVSDFFNSKYNDFINEAKNIKGKLGNLSETNYQLGLKHIENGNISDAIFRFKFINKMWPQNQDAYYYLAYCLYLKKEGNKAKESLEKLFKINPDYDIKAKELLDKIEHNIPLS